MEKNMTHHFRPLLDRVLAKRVEASEKTAAGVIIPDTAKEKPIEALVLAIGTGVPNDSGAMRPLVAILPFVSTVACPAEPSAVVPVFVNPARAVV